MATTTPIQVTATRPTVTRAMATPTDTPRTTECPTITRVPPTDRRRHIPTPTSAGAPIRTALGRGRVDMWATDRAEVSVMTEEQARSQTEGLLFGGRRAHVETQQYGHQHHPRHRVSSG